MRHGCPRVKQNETPIVAGKVKSRGQPCRAASDNGAVQRLRTHRVRPHSSQKAAYKVSRPSRFIDMLLPAALLTLIVVLRRHSVA